MKQRIFYTELAYILGLPLLALGTAFIESTNFGLSMVVAPAYVLHLKLSKYLSFFSFGMASYTLQAILLLVMMLILRKAKLSYLFSFVTAVLYGFTLDGTIALFALLPAVEFMLLRVIFYILGLAISSMGLALLFRTYISPEAYDLFVKEMSVRFHARIDKFKTCYDCVSCLVAIVLSFSFFGFLNFQGVGLGTVICALLNGTLIRLWTAFFEKRWTFKEAFPWFKTYF